MARKYTSRARTRPVRKKTVSRRRSPVRRAAPARRSGGTQTLRIVLEQPANTGPDPVERMLTPTTPRKARF